MIDFKDIDFGINDSFVKIGKDKEFITYGGKNCWYFYENNECYVTKDTQYILENIANSASWKFVPQSKLTNFRGIMLGLYKIYYTTKAGGGFSYACVGQTHDGTLWYSCSNWTTESKENPMVASTDWNSVKRVEWIAGNR